MPTFIYALKDPETRKIRYIGVTTDPRKRLQKHLADPCRCHRVHWIQSLKNRGLVPEMEILVQVPKSEWAEWEVKFIRTARQMGLNLVNGSDGGPGGRNPTPGVRKKHGSGMRGRKHTPETRAKQSASALGKPKSPEARASMSAAWRGKAPSLACQEAAVLANTGRTQSADERAARSASLRGKPKSPEARRNMSIAAKAREENRRALI